MRARLIRVGIRGGRALHRVEVWGCPRLWLWLLPYDSSPTMLRPHHYEILYLLTLRLIQYDSRTALSSYPYPPHTQHTRHDTTTHTHSPNPILGIEACIFPLLNHLVLHISFYTASSSSSFGVSTIPSFCSSIHPQQSAWPSVRRFHENR
mgnify:CR=1 FL=1